MGHGLCNGTAAPWVMGCKMVLIPHGSWVVQQYGDPMGHGSHNSMVSPWVVDCAMVLPPHGAWVAQ